MGDEIERGSTTALAVVWISALSHFPILCSGQRCCKAIHCIQWSGRHHQYCCSCILESAHESYPNNSGADAHGWGATWERQSGLHSKSANDSWSSGAA